MIRQIAVSLLLIVCLSFSTGCNKKPAEDPTKPFEGTWWFIEDGKQTTKQAIFETGTFQAIDVKEAPGKGITGAVRLADAVDSGPFHVDPAPTPAHIDFVTVTGANQGKRRKGIFVFEGATLRICVAPYDAPRPTEFASGGENLLMVLARNK